MTDQLACFRKLCPNLKTATLFFYFCIWTCTKVPVFLTANRRKNHLKPHSLRKGEFLIHDSGNLPSCQLTNDRSMLTTCLSSGMHLHTRSMYCRASSGRRPAIKIGKSCECVACINFISLSVHSNCVNGSPPSSLLVRSAASSNGSSVFSSSWKCALQCSCQDLN